MLHFATKTEMLETIFNMEDIKHGIEFDFSDIKCDENIEDLQGLYSLDFTKFSDDRYKGTTHNDFETCFWVRSNSDYFTFGKHIFNI